MVIDILITKFFFFADKYLSYYLSDQMNLVNQKYDLVEVYVNGSPEVYILNRKKLMSLF